MYNLSDEVKDWINSAFTIVDDELVWARDGGRGVKAGDKVPACINSTGYYCVKINVKPRKTMLLHRIKWFVAYGEYPDCAIDHINLNPLDNRLNNLRLATRSQNKFNTKKKARKNNLPLGVHQRGKKFIATISKNRNKTYLGSFNTAEEAHNAWFEAGRKLYGDYVPCQS